MRGLPYSGKSKRAKELAGETGTVHSANDYFMVNGVYRYDVRQIRQAHYETYEGFKKSLLAGIPIVICDNCNMQIWEFQEYIDLARGLDYEIIIVTMPNWPAIVSFKESNWRGIPEQKFYAMWQKFEPFELTAPSMT